MSSYLILIRKCNGAKPFLLTSCVPPSWFIASGRHKSTFIRTHQKERERGKVGENGAPLVLSYICCHCTQRRNIFLLKSRWRCKLKKCLRERKKRERCWGGGGGGGGKSLSSKSFFILELALFSSSKWREKGGWRMWEKRVGETTFGLFLDKHKHNT